jgi:SOS response regulatory protein OraA/RecX
MSSSMPDDAFGTVVNALARRDLTSFELQQRLVRAGFDPATCTDALARAAGSGYVDDARVALERALHLAERGSSDAVIRAELLRRGVPDDGVEMALAAIPAEGERAEQLASRLGGGLRAARALARKGYPEDVVERAIRARIAESP